MKRLSSAVLAVLLATIAVPVLAGPARADLEPQPQTIEFTSAAPSGATYNQNSNFGDYAPTATSSSGLPVQLSVDSSNDACASVPGVIGSPDAVGRISVFWQRPGICTIYADQAGDDEFLPAQRVVQTVVIGKDQPVLVAPKAGKALLGLTPTTFRAELLHETRVGPSGNQLRGYPGELVSFSVAGKVLCSATTVFQELGPFDWTAVATCKAPIGLGNALSQTSYTVTYAGNDFSGTAIATGKLG